jgi:signal transduction histidine kinase
LDAITESCAVPSLAGPLREIRRLIEQTIQGTRSLTSELSPPVLYEVGFEAAVKQLAERLKQQHGIRCDFEDDKQNKPVDDSIRVVLFQAVRELLVNVAKHSGASRAKVSVGRDGGDVRVTVEDNGIGFDVMDIHPSGGSLTGYGLFNIRDRVDRLGGHLEIRSERGGGTLVTLVAPLKCRKNPRRRK